MKARLVPPAISYRISYVQALKEGFRRGDHPAMAIKQIHRIDADFEAFVDELTDTTGVIILPDGNLLPKVPDDVFWLVDGETFIGETSVRYELNEFLIKIGGHCGYGIRPMFQKLGYGKLILQLALNKIWARGIERALITCYEHNIASARVIEANGGRLENLIIDPRGGGRSKRYWIEKPRDRAND